MGLCPSGQLVIVYVCPPDRSCVFNSREIQIKTDYSRRAPFRTPELPSGNEDVRNKPNEEEAFLFGFPLEVLHARNQSLNAFLRACIVDGGAESSD